MWYIEKECQYCSWSPCTIQVGWTIWSENMTSHNISFLSTTHIMLPCIPEKYMHCTWYILYKQNILCRNSQKKSLQKYQHKERYNPRKYHMYQKMIRKCKFLMGNNTWNINLFEKKCLGDRHYPQKSKHQHNTTKSQKLKKVESTCGVPLNPRELLHIKDLFPVRVTI